MKTEPAFRHTSTIARDKLKAQGFRRLDVMLTPAAVTALEKLMADGTPARTAVAQALIDLAKPRKGTT